MKIVNHFVLAIYVLFLTIGNSVLKISLWWLIATAVCVPILFRIIDYIVSSFSVIESNEAESAELPKE